VSVFEKLFSKYQQREDIYALQKLAPLSNAYIPWSKSSIRPSAMAIILNELLINDRKVIVEFGSGISTIYIAKVLDECGGHIYSFEHDEGWFHFISSQLEKNNLSECVSLTYAPLRKSTYSLKNSLWYDESIVRNKIKNSIDMMIIDGPPAYSKESSLSRYPAVPVLQSRLSKNYCIICDDIVRNGERKIVKMWEKELDIVFSRSYIKGGIAIGRTGPSFTVY